MQQSLDTLTLVPAGRLGRVLGDARSRQGESLRALAEATGFLFSPEELAAVEAGTRTLADEEIVMLARIYGVETATFMPARTRLVIDLHARTVTIGETTGKASRRDSLTEGVLTRYLALLYQLRNERPGQSVRLRQLDIDVLGEALWLEPNDIQDRLVGLMAHRVKEITRKGVFFGRRLVVPAVGILVAITAAGTLVLESRTDLLHQDAARRPASSPQPSAGTVRVEVESVLPVAER